mgnify:CR=1 FL=1
MRDISARKASDEEREKFAYIDALTELPNRRMFEQNYARNIHRVKRHDHQLALFFIDLDRFKPVNDKYGHKVGDALLVAVANCLKKTIRDEDFLSRLGGDEFLVMLYPLHLQS